MVEAHPSLSDFDKLPEVNEVIVSEKNHAKYRLTQVLGSGGYGTVFECVEENSSKKYAFKAEKYSKSMLHVEATVLKKASQTNCTRILQYIEYGSSKPNYSYLVMTLLGKDLSSLRTDQATRRFSPPTAVRIGIQSLRAIEELHKIGFISRDIKPGNFAIGADEDARRLFLFDFGLARKYMDDNGNIIPPRKDIGWRGTTRYGSLQAHLKQDLSRKDDVESWFYLLVEITKGSVPWRLSSDRDAVKVMKFACRTTTRISFLERCPAKYNEILTLIDSLTFPDTPNYDKITGLLEAVMKDNTFTWTQPFDWEDPKKLSQLTLPPSSGAEETKKPQRSN